jgi:hypothetical protein
MVATTASAFRALSRSTAIGGFLQDSFAPTGNLTFNVGLRYDAQVLFGDRPGAALSLPNQLAPRVGVIYDVTGKGRSRLFANYARYYENVPLDIIDRTFSGESTISALHKGTTCTPRQSSPGRGGCQLDAIGVDDQTGPVWAQFGNGHAPVDPGLSGQSSSEIVIGGEYEILAATRIGATYTKRWQNRIIEDMSPDDAATFFVGNPGYGQAKAFPVATRNYDAFTVYLERAFRRGFLAQASYTVSALRGNWGGLFKSETIQLDPNMTSDFDLISLLPNRTGPLPGDHTHQIKVYAAKAFPLGESGAIDLGLAFRSRSGEPTTYLGSHPLYGPGEVYILPRGSGERLPWVHTLDLRTGMTFPLGAERSLAVSMDIFNVLNLQSAVATDQRYTLDSVSPIAYGKVSDLDQLKTSDGMAFDPHHKSPSFGDPIAYQPPRAFRFGMRVTL